MSILQKVLQALFITTLILLFVSLYFKYTPKTLAPVQSVEIPQLVDQNALLKNINWIEIKKNAPWQERDSGAQFVFKDKLWLMGGLKGDSVANGTMVKYWDAPHFNDIWNTEDGVNWKLIKSSSEWKPRRSLSVVELNGSLFMTGGWSPITGYTNDVWKSEDGINWQRILDKAPWPPREGQILLTFQNKIWLIGGVNYDARETKNDVWSSSDGINWELVTDKAPWTSRWDHSVAVFKDKLFLSGGMNLNDQVFQDVWSSSDGINWELVTDKAPWEKRQGYSLLVYKNKLWTLGRLNDAIYGGPNDIWFSEDGITWNKTKYDAPWEGREDFFSAVFKDRLIIFGGMSASWKWLNDVWISTI